MPAHQTPDPSPEQIRQMCVEIQAKWTPTMERTHRISRVVDGKLTTGGGDDEWEPPTIATAEIQTD